MVRVLVSGAHSQLAQCLAYTQASFEGLQATFLSKQALDITHLDQLQAYLSKHPVDYLINCAAYTQVDQAEREKEQAFAVNALGPSYLASLAQARGFTLFHISTDYVFDGTCSRPYTENMLPNPINYYGQTKLAGEQELLATNPAAYIIRTSWLYSVWGNNFLTRFLAQVQQGQPIRMVYDQVGSPTYAPDLANAIWAMIQQLSQSPGLYLPGIYHYANEGVASRYDFAWAIMRYTGLTDQLIPVLTKDFSPLVQRPAYSVLGKEKIKQQFGLKIRHWQDSLAHCIQHVNLRV